MGYYALFYHVVDGFVERRLAFREAHLSHARGAANRGELVLEAFENPNPHQAGHIAMKELDRRASDVDARRRQLQTQQTELKHQRHQLAVGNRLRQRVSDFANQAANGIDALDFGRARLGRV